MPAAAEPGALGPRTAVVGAGVSGLTCARELAAHGFRVTVYEREAAIGGRLGSRDSEAGRFDAGAQFLSARLPRFAAELRHWIDAGTVRPWQVQSVALAQGQLLSYPAQDPHFVGVPAMQSIAAHLARGLELVTGAAVGQLANDGQCWSLADGGGRVLAEGIELLVLALPSPEALRLARGFTDVIACAEELRWDPCWTAMLALGRPSGVEFDCAFVDDDPILGWISRDNSKPSYQAVDGVAERWMLQARPNWSRSYLEFPEAEAARWMQRAFAARLGRPLVPAAAVAVRWRTATPVNPLPEACLWDGERRIGFAGDWCGGPRVEGAYLSGLALAELIGVEIGAAPAAADR